MEGHDIRMYEARPTVAKLYGSGFVMTAIGNSSADVLERHAHAHPYFCFVRDGEIGEKVGGRSRQAAAGSLLYHAQGVRHTNDFGPRGAVRLNIEITSPGGLFDGALREAMARSADLSDTSAASLGEPLERALYEADSVAAGTMLQELLRELLSPRRRSEQEPRWMTHIAALVRAEFRGRWSLAGVARDAGVNPSHAAREYRRRFGRTVGQHVTQLRIEYAASALLESDVTLADLALDAGFSDQSHFCRVFRSRMGMTPTAFRSGRAGNS